MYCGRRIWQLGRVHARILVGRNRIQAGPTLPSRLALSRPYTRQALNLAYNLITPDSPIADIHKGYHALIDELKLPENKLRTRMLWRSETASILSVKELDFIIQRLVESGRTFDMDLVVCILSDMQTFFHLDPKIVQSTIIDALIRAEDCRRLFRWYLRVPKLPGRAQVSQEQYHALLKLCGKRKDATVLLDAVHSMGRSPTRPDLETLRIALQAGFDANIDNDSFLKIFRDMAGSKVPFDPAFGILIEENCPDDPIRARRILYLYAKASGSVSRAAYQTFQGCERLRKEAELKGAQAAVQLFHTMQKDEGGPQIDRRAAVFAIFSCAQSIKDLEFLSTEFDKALDVRDWADLIRNLCWHARPDEALFAYRKAKEQGIQPDPAMVRPLVKLLCRTMGRSPRLAGRTPGGAPSESDIEQAYQIYEDLLQSQGPEFQPGTAIYQSLLGALSTSSLRKHYDQGVSIVNDMISRKVVLRDSRTTAAVIVWTMRYSQSYEEAFRVYRKLRGPLDGVGYLIVLDCFCKLELGPEPTVQYCFDMIRDMRASQVEVKPHVYTIMLRQFAKFYTSPEQRRLLAEDPELYNRVVSAIRRVHDFLTIDSSFTPETHLWTQLMDTYQRLGCFADAMRVWDYLYLSGQISGPGVSIILDACGFAGSEAVARQVLAGLDKAGYIMDQNNWRSYVECLCRVGNIDEALRVLCIDMASAGADVAPDEATARVVRRFSRSYMLEDEVDKRIEKYLPELWQSMMEKDKALGGQNKQDPDTRLTTL